MSARGDLVVSVPASTANLGAGFDTLAMALGLRVEAGGGPPPQGARSVGPTHPLAVAHRAAGGDGTVWLRSSIPEGRGLGFSGAVRVAGAAHAAAVAGVSAERIAGTAFEVAAALEQHPDNAAASAFGGLVVTGAGHVIPVPVAIRADVVVWIPSVTTSTDRSRAQLPDVVPFVDAVHNLGRAALFVAAMVTGDTAALRDASADRLHQDQRLRQVPGGAEVLGAATRAGALCAWLSGSGPTIACLVPAGPSIGGSDDVGVDAQAVMDELTAVSAAVGVEATVRRLAPDPSGVVIVEASSGAS